MSQDTEDAATAGAAEPVTRILFLAAEPTDQARLRLAQEVREIEESRRQAPLRDRYAISQVFAATPADLRREILNNRPTVVHFSGHGTGQGGLALQDSQGNSRLVTTEALEGLFKLFQGRVDCVILNACLSSVQAEVIGRYVPFVIGMSQEIGDRAALNFSQGFYDALFAGEPVDRAFEFGRSSIQLESLPTAVKADLVNRSMTVPDEGQAAVQALPEYMKPVLIQSAVKPVPKVKQVVRRAQGAVLSLSRSNRAVLGVGSALGGMLVMGLLFMVISGRGKDPVPPPHDDVVANNLKNDTPSDRGATRSDHQTKAVAEEESGGVPLKTSVGAKAKQLKERVEDSVGGKVKQLKERVEDSVSDKVKQLTAQPPVKGSVWRARLWPMWSTIRVKFLNAETSTWTKHLRDKVKEYLPQWTEGTNLTLKWVDDGPADITVNFLPTADLPLGTTNSYTGTQSREIVPSLNYILPEGTPEKQLRRLILHEFGHALGLMEEHQNPKANIRWDEPAVVAYYGKRGLSEEATRFHVLNRYTTAELAGYRDFDIDSVMIFDFPPGLTKNGFDSAENDTLSKGDLAFVARLYPRDMLSVGGPAGKGSIAGKGHTDSFRFAVTDERLYTVETESEADFRICLFGPDDEDEPFTKDGTGEPRYSPDQIREKLKPGRYLLRVRHSRIDGTGDYRVSVK